MPRIFGHHFTNGDYEYDLEVTLDDEAIVNDRLTFEVIAQRRHFREETWQAVTVSLDYNFEKNTVEVSVEGKHIGTIDLPSLRPLFDDAVSIMAEAVTPSLDHVIEKIVQSVPVPEPILGCLLKAGISTLVGQLLRCLNRISEGAKLGQRIRETAGCLRRNGIAMLSTAARRTLVCMATLGLGG